MNIVNAYSKMMGDDGESPIGWVFSICTAFAVGAWAGYLTEDVGPFFIGIFSVMMILMLFAHLGKPND